MWGKGMEIGLWDRQDLTQSKVLQGALETCSTISVQERADTGCAVYKYTSSIPNL